MTLLDPRELTPIDVAEVRRRFNRTMNVPGTEYPDLEIHLDAVNDERIPHTARTALLAGLPYVVVEIAKELKAEREAAGNV